MINVVLTCIFILSDVISIYYVNPGETYKSDYVILTDGLTNDCFMIEERRVKDKRKA